ncbi:hypothetical protein QTP88_009662 [Uroleucon formosanum]
MEEKKVFYEKLDEYYKLKSKKNPFAKYAQLQKIAEIKMAKIKTGKKFRRQYYLLSTYDIVIIAEEKFLIYKQNAADEKISKRATKVANELLSILFTFGAQKILQSDNGREFLNSVINELKDIWPECVIVHGRPRHPQSQGSIKRSNQDVEHMLRACMADNKSKKLYLEMSNDPKIGLSMSNFSSDQLKKLTTEKDLEHIPQTTETKKLFDVDLPLSKIAENNKIICQLCDSSKKIKIQHELGHEGQIIAAEKMIKIFLTYLLQKSQSDRNALTL